MKSIKSCLNRIMYVIHIQMSERKYNRLKYILKKCPESNILVVVFSGFRETQRQNIIICGR